MKTFFDVGAERGTDSIPLAKQYPDILFYAFEPNPYMIEHLKKETAGLSNYIIIPKAVSNYNGVSNFNINKFGPVGVSSLLEYSEKARENWSGFALNVDEKVDVEVITLESFIKEHNIKKIDFFHCDTQGSDLNVLKGLGDCIHIIEEGQVEAAILKESLYLNQNNYQETMLFLASKGFEILSMKAEGNQRECNIHFKKFSLSFSI
jgi:FkbM family methyltransferase